MASVGPAGHVPVVLSADDHQQRERLGPVFVVVPAYRASATIARVVARALTVADRVIVVDDACPQRSGDVVEGCDERVTVLRHDRNRGVGGATKTGIAHAMVLGARYIVKVDADDQMDCAYVPHMVALLSRYPEIDLVKGNRFADAATLTTMPRLRLVGNAALTFLVKFSSGYWTLVDPTNGFFMLRAATLRNTNLEQLAERYFFEIDLLCSLGARRRVIAELEMPAIYGEERSSLSIPHVMLSFPGRLVARFLRRLFINYLLVEINAGTLCAVLGIPLLALGLAFGGYEWAQSIAQGVPRPTGTIILALLLFIIGFQLSLQALLYDVQFATRTIKVRRDPADPNVDTDDVFFR